MEFFNTLQDLIIAADASVSKYLFSDSQHFLGVYFINVQKKCCKIENESGKKTFWVTMKLLQY
jgi:hypothetical protein